ncbi:hypothetical protein GGR52DRAFT_189773 [Hypoxylon sp. FL1284]|nr:hypothetical protein GGR52DRAFT_189773 [Hypoxylon sp. FL1284]
MLRLPRGMGLIGLMSCRCVGCGYLASIGVFHELHCVVSSILLSWDGAGTVVSDLGVSAELTMNRACIVGDAAHATIPWQGAGAGISIEDAFVLSHLIGNVSSAGEISAVFKAFDAVRRPRCQRVIDTGRDSGRLFCGQAFGHVGALDLESHKEDALTTTRTFLDS